MPEHAWHRAPAVAAALVVLAMAVPAAACLWDRDTLRDERRGLPGIAEVLAGKVERHSRLFYETRAERSRAAIERDPNDLAAYDDLAVALEKLDDTGAAIEVMLRKDRVAPGQYTTHANLGTFHLHKGDLDAGIAHIRKAIEINPDAHFGRETYQLRVAEYLRRAKDDPTVFDGGSFVLPLLLPRGFEEAGLSPADRAGRAKVLRIGRGKRDDPAIEKAITGVVGMLRFGPGTSPHLYHALGDLLAARGDKHLAFRAYQRARDHGHPRPEQVREAMDQVRGLIEHQHDLDATVIAAERADAERWVKAYQEFEDAQIRAGKAMDGDDAAYAPFYAEHGEAKLTPPPVRLRYLLTANHIAIAGLALLAVALVVRWVLHARRRTRARAMAAAAT